jgi:RNA polymerase subunit RPABC4/transcription elongation factor Spt4
MKTAVLPVFLIFFLCMIHVGFAEELISPVVLDGEEFNLPRLKAKAEQGVIAAQRDLGNEYLLGGNIKQDFNLAFLWLYKAAVGGDVTAQLNLAWLYEQGRGISKSMEDSIKWYSIAARNGSSVAAQQLTRIRNKPTKKDPNHVGSDFCSFCGKALPNAAKFCSHCGEQQQVKEILRILLLIDPESSEIINKMYRITSEMELIIGKYKWALKENNFLIVNDSKLKVWDIELPAGLEGDNIQLTFEADRRKYRGPLWGYGNWYKKKIVLNSVLQEFKPHIFVYVMTITGDDTQDAFASTIDFNLFSYNELVRKIIAYQKEEENRIVEAKIKNLEEKQKELELKTIEMKTNIGRQNKMNNLLLGIQNELFNINRTLKYGF